MKIAFADPRLLSVNWWLIRPASFSEKRHLKIVSILLHIEKQTVLGKMPDIPRNNFVSFNQGRRCNQAIKRNEGNPL